MSLVRIKQRNTPTLCAGPLVAAGCAQQCAQQCAALQPFAFFRALPRGAAGGFEALDTALFRSCDSLLATLLVKRKILRDLTA